MDEPELKIIDVFICKLRKKLANASNGKNYIETVWGRGYVAAGADRGRGQDTRLTFQDDCLKAKPRRSGGVFVCACVQLEARTLNRL